MKRLVEKEEPEPKETDTGANLRATIYSIIMPPKSKKYKLWQKDRSIPIPKRTLARLKGNSKDSHECIFEEETSRSTEEWDIDGYESESIQEECDYYVGKNGNDNFVEADCEIGPHLNFQNSSEPCHLAEDDDYRDSESDLEYLSESESETSHSGDDLENEGPIAPRPLYPGTSITVEESILSIMKYGLRTHIRHCRIFRV